MVIASQAEPRATRGQTAPVAGSSQGERAKRTQGDNILQDITKLRDLYDQKQGKAVRPILFEEAEAMFKKVLETRELRADNAYKRVKELIKTAEKVAGRLTEKYKKGETPRSYAQAVYIENAGAAHRIAIKTPPTAHPREKKKL
jgi:hypothetical protein